MQLGLGDPTLAASSMNVWGSLLGPVCASLFSQVGFSGAGTVSGSTHGDCSSLPHSESQGLSF